MARHGRPGMRRGVLMSCRRGALGTDGQGTMGAGCVFRVGQTTSNRGGQDGLRVQASHLDARALQRGGVCVRSEKKNQQMGAGCAGVHALAQPKIEKPFLYFKPTTSLLRITVHMWLYMHQ